MSNLLLPSCVGEFMPSCPLYAFRGRFGQVFHPMPHPHGCSAEVWLQLRRGRGCKLQLLWNYVAAASPSVLWLRFVRVSMSLRCFMRQHYATLLAPRR